MNFIHNINLVLTRLGGKPHLFHQGPDIVHRVIGSGIQFMDIKGRALIKGPAGSTFIASFPVAPEVLAIDRFSQYPGAGRLTHSPGAAKQKGVRQLFAPDGIFKRGGNMSLPHNRIKGLWPVFSC